MQQCGAVVEQAGTLHFSSLIRSFESHDLDDTTEVIPRRRIFFFSDSGCSI